MCVTRAAVAPVVIDTNVLLDLYVFHDVGVRVLADALGAGAVLARRSEAIDAEFTDVLSRPQFDLSPQRQTAILAAWQTLAVAHTTPPTAPLVCSDADDQKFLDLALAVQARWLVTKDRALRRLARRARPWQLAIVPPQAFALPSPDVSSGRPRSR